MELHGAVVEHPDMELPDFILGEEARLRSLEKQRMAGEQRASKSSSSRSTEVVAQRLTQPPKVGSIGSESGSAGDRCCCGAAQSQHAGAGRASEDSFVRRSYVVSRGGWLISNGGEKQALVTFAGDWAGPTLWIRKPAWVQSSCMRLVVTPVACRCR